MSEKEERIVLVIGNRQDIEELAYLYPWEKLDKTKRITFDRAEAVERMAKAMSADDVAVEGYKVLAEAAMDALITELK